MRKLLKAATGAIAVAAFAVLPVAPAHAGPTVGESGATTMGQVGMSHSISATPGAAPQEDAEEQSEDTLRVATFNASLYRDREGELARDLRTTGDEQAQAVAEIIQRTAPDVVLLNEFDYDGSGEAAELFRDNYLAAGQNGQPGQDYPYFYTAPSNTGLQTGADLNKDGTVGGPDDAYGYGEFEGQYGMVLFSKHPILADQVRTFQEFRWQDMPGSLLPTDYYGPLVSGMLRLSSKSHWDVPVSVNGRTIHLLAAHPTPPAFDGEEQRNGRRNHDEIRLLADYVSGGSTAEYIYDDEGVAGGLPSGSDFVILGDLNADPNRGDSYDNAAAHVTEHPLVTDPAPRRTVVPAKPSSGLGRYLDLPAPQSQSGRSDPSRALGTADFGAETGTLRVDYVLPSKTLDVVDAGIFWPNPGQPGAELVAMDPPRSSDHRLVWADVRTAS
ncbi:endonuclease/exonuclease/phosphatase family protein [Zhihengliuella alba]|uniref:Endonuclease/exonuclease/phosphatase family protein n=1 Tax=Zhihengliuella alba TaxID=547018 RepID=A0ABP7DZG8_9MICC